MKTALFPGSFDPPTKGHLDLIKRASKVCDKLVVGIAVNPQKEASLFLPEEKQDLLNKVTKGMKGIEIISFTGLVAQFAKEKKFDYIIRGLRAFSDFEYEFRMALTNRRLSGIETVFLMSDERHVHINSSLIREIAHFGARLDDFIPKEIEDVVYTRLKQ